MTRATWGILSYFFLGMLQSCGPDPDPVFKYEYTIINTAGFAVILSCHGCETVTLEIDEEIILKTNTLFTDYSVEPTATTTQKIDFEETDTDEWTIRSYENDLIYRVFEPDGLACIADVSFINEHGDPLQYINVTLPATYAFREFPGDSATISAKHKSGSIKLRVEIYWKEKLIETDGILKEGETAVATIWDFH